jgi:hypothetical protein
MRQLVCMSADVYYQNFNNRQYSETSYLYLNLKKGKQARCRRDRAQLKIELASVVKMAFGERLTISGKS